MDEVDMSEEVVEEKITDSKIKPTKTVKIKKVRKRTKGLLKNIQSQMEFYFSDSNLQKDRFIKQEIDKDKQGYVDLSLFLKFNKIQKMTEDLTLICKAVGKSEKLKLNEDGNKVKRASPFVERDVADIDSRTVYVECLPRNVDHEWMKRVFSECGVVNYVSLPKFKSTGDTKGFGFIEFETRKAADKACEFRASHTKTVANNNEEAIFNPWCSTYTLLEWIRRKCKCGHGFTIDLIDLEGHVRNLSTGIEEYANDLLHGRETYILIRVERESESGHNRYISLLNNLEQSNPELMVKLNNLSRPTTRKKDRDRQKKNNHNHSSRSIKGHRLESPTKRPTSSERHNKHRK